MYGIAEAGLFLHRKCDRNRDCDRHRGDCRNCGYRRHRGDCDDRRENAAPQLCLRLLRFCGQCLLYQDVEEIPIADAFCLEDLRVH